VARYIVGRCLQLVPTLLGISIICFFLIRLVPGDPALAILGISATPDDIEYIRELYGLDKPVFIQYIIWVKKVLCLDFGKSIYSNEDISGILISRVPVSFQLALLSMFISLSISMPAGIISAVKRNSFLDRLICIFTTAGISIPGFWLGIILIYVFGVVFPVFPLYGFVNIFSDFTEGLKHLFLPAFTLGLSLASFTCRMTRAGMIGVLNENYIITARAKGLKEATVITKHAFRNTLIPLTTVIGIQTGTVLGGSALIEVVFALPGLGRLLVDSIFTRDYPVVQIIVLLYAIMFVLINLLSDILYTFLDPRIVYS
jgi:peptide/nickel transport system permease protein